MLTAQDIFDFLSTELGVDTTGLTPSTPLFSTEVVDSFSLVSVIEFLERRASIQIDPMDVSLENLDSVERMLAYVKRQGS